jgi:hypothetical protein
MTFELPVINVPLSAFRLEYDLIASQNVEVTTNATHLAPPAISSIIR